MPVLIDSSGNGEYTASVEKKKALIITDNSRTVTDMAHIIANVVNEGEFGYSAAIILAENFSGSDILPVHAFFLGCDGPFPVSFFYIEELFDHINLAGRKCGCFSGDKKAIKYLSRVIRNCEAAPGKPLLAKSNELSRDEAQNWIQNILK